MANEPTEVVRLSDVAGKGPPCTIACATSTPGGHPFARMRPVLRSSYSEGALKNHQQLQRTAGAAPFAFQASDKGGLHGNAPFTLPHKSLGLG